MLTVKYRYIDRYQDEHNGRWSIGDIAGVKKAHLWNGIAKKAWRDCTASRASQRHPLICRSGHSQLDPEILFLTFSCQYFHAHNLLCITDLRRKHGHRNELSLCPSTCQATEPRCFPPGTFAVANYDRAVIATSKQSSKTLEPVQLNASLTTSFHCKSSKMSPLPFMLKHIMPHFQHGKSDSYIYNPPFLSSKW